MAKLSVVVPSNEVEVGGVKYRKVDRKAQAGDIVKVLVDDYTDVEEGAYYSVINKEGETGFYDDDGDFRDDAVQYYPKDFEVYEKVTEPMEPEYREVKRMAEKGERIRIVDRWSSADPYENGAELVVKLRLDTHRIEVEVNGRNTIVSDKEYVVLEPVNVTKPAEPAPQPVRLKVGEYAKVVDTNGCKLAKEGDIIMVEAAGHLLCGNTFDGRYISMFSHRFIRATESEVEAAKKAAERAKNIGEFADGGYAEVKSDAEGYLSGGYRESYVKVRPTEVKGPYALEISLPEQRGYGAYCNADALRKVTREEYEEATKPKPVFNLGEKVRLLNGGGFECLHGFKDGDVCEVIRNHHTDDTDVRIERDGGGIGYAKPEQLEKVSGEEVARIEEEAKWAAIGRKVGEFKRGDIVRGEGVHSSKLETGEVQDVGTDVIGVHVAGSAYSAMRKVDVTLIVPIEQRFDKGGASTSK